MILTIVTHTYIRNTLCVNLPNLFTEGFDDPGDFSWMGGKIPMDDIEFDGKRESGKSEIVKAVEKEEKEDVFMEEKALLPEKMQPISTEEAVKPSEDIKKVSPSRSKFQLVNGCGVCSKLYL